MKVRGSEFSDDWAYMLLERIKSPSRHSLGNKRGIGQGVPADRVQWTVTYPHWLLLPMCPAGPRCQNVQLVLFSSGEHIP